MSFRHRVFSVILSGPSGTAPLLPFSDDFSSGATLGSRWTGATWTISGGKALNTPTVTGAEILADGNMEAVGVANWADYNTPTTKDKSAVQVHGGSQALRVIGDAANDGVVQTVTLTPHKFYKVSSWGYGGSPRANAEVCINGDTVYLNAIFNAEAWVENNTYGLYLSGTAFVRFCQRDGGTGTFYIDDCSVKEITLASLIASVEAEAADVTVTATLTPKTDLDFVTRNPIGIILNLDSASNPLNFVMAHNDGGANSRLRLYKCVNGIYTSLIDVPLASGAISVTKSGTTYTLYQDGVQKGDPQTVNDAGVINNTLHGMLSTHPEGTIDDFSIVAV